jgi:LPS-assembly lipoprotein
MKKFIVGLLLISLSACGWHLRGSAASGDKLAMTTPLDLVIITKDNHSPLINALRQSLSAYKINEITDATKAGLSLSVDREILDKRTAGVGSDALTSAYELILRADYSVSNANGIITPLDTSARISRTYNYNVNNANGAAQEEELVLREMRRELAQTILRRVKNLSTKPAPTAAQ